MLGFELTKEQEGVREEAKEFAERVIAPRAADIDKTDKFPWEVWKEMGKLPYRYAGHLIPKEYDGHPRHLLESCIIMEEITAVGGSSVCSAILEGVSLGTQPIIIGGNEEQKRKFLPRIAKGEGLCCFALTEPGTGSDASNIKTKAEKAGKEYVINGRKRYASFAHISDYIVLFAKTAPEKGAKGVSAFIVEKDTPGFEVLERVPCMGLRGHQDEELLFKDCKIPEETLIGEEGKGFYYAMGTLDETRTTLTAGFVGLARAAFEAAVDYAKRREAFGAKLAEKQAINLELADLATEIEAAKLLMLRAAWLSDQGKRHTAETAKAKSFATKVMLNATNLAIDVYGGFGCTERYPVERYYRDARIWAFAQGAPNIMRLIVARSLFGMRKLV